MSVRRDNDAGLFPDADESSQFAALALVAPERGLDNDTGGLTYGLPGHLSHIGPGQRVVVPLGRGDKATPAFVLQVTPVDAAGDGQGQDDDKPYRIKPVLSADTTSPRMSPALIELAQWMSKYYCCPLGMVFATMMPAAVRRGASVPTQWMVRLAPGGSPNSSDGSGDSAPAPVATGDDQPDMPSRISKQQRAILDVLRELPHDEPWMTMHAAMDAAQVKTDGPVKRLAAHGHVIMQRKPAADPMLERYEKHRGEHSSSVTLTDGQAKALAHLTAHVHHGFGVHLIHGVTSSGKTEVYLRLIDALRSMDNRAARAAGYGGVIVLVPEIALTPQTVGRFAARFADVAVLHSGLTAGQRQAQWQRIGRGEASVVIGARSAIFAPLPSVDLIIVDEEHDSSYKQDQLPRYHARDLAIRRGQLENACVVLGSATPSLESFYNAGPDWLVNQDVPTHWDTSEHEHSEDPTATVDQLANDGASTAGTGPTIPHVPEKWLSDIARPSVVEAGRDGRYLLSIASRVAGKPLPTVRVVDMIDQRRKRYEMTGKGGIHLLSLPLEVELTRVLDEGGQAMLLLNRRGYANYIACPDQQCGWVLTCDHCDASMVYHRHEALPTGGLMRCHHCDAQTLLPELCPLCKKRVTVFGMGTQRVEEELTAKFPATTMQRMDSDTMRQSSKYFDALEKFRSGETRILLGTQMIAKGLDFPDVALVGVIHADTAMHMPDFRAAERTFSLICQVAGRAGRSDRPGLVIVQTFCPQDPTIALAARHDYVTFAARELTLRRRVGLPPVGRMVRIVVRHTDNTAAVTRAAELAGQLTQLIENQQLAVRLRGPSPCAISRVADHFRHQIELLAPPPGGAMTLQKLLAAARSQGLVISDRHTAVDVDPVSML